MKWIFQKPFYLVNYLFMVPLCCLSGRRHKKNTTDYATWLEVSLLSSSVATQWSFQFSVGSSTVLVWCIDQLFLPPTLQISSIIKIDINLNYIIAHRYIDGISELQTREVVHSKYLENEGEKISQQRCSYFGWSERLWVTQHEYWRTAFME